MPRPFGKILQAGADGQGNGPAEGSRRQIRRHRAKGHAHSQALGDVVEGYGQHQQG